MSDIWIVAARRTAMGKFLGTLANTSAVDLALAAAEAVLSGIDRKSIDQVILGNVLGAGLGMNIARQLALRLELPIETPAYSVNMMCASGLQAVALARQAIKAGDARAVLCGGTESMSQAPYLLNRARSGYKLGDGVLIDTVLRDGLTDPLSKDHMGLSAEAIAKARNITRAQQDAFAVQSQQRYATAHAAGRFADEIVPVNGLDRDEHARADTSLEKLSTLKPAFDKTGTVTAGNASGINDGAAMLLVCDAAVGKANGWKPLAKIVDAVSVGCEPATMGFGPVHATRKLCERLKVTPNHFDAVELNEAFAAQALGCIGDLALDQSIVNRDGGAIAMGHPIGASGARIATHLAHAIARGEAKHALASLCVGGGMGISMTLEPA